MNESQALAALTAMSQATRLQILKHLVSQGEAGDSAGAIGRAVDAMPSRVSFHLSSLEQAGLISSTRQARQIIYRVDFERIGAVIRYLMLDCCQGDERVVQCCPSSSRRKRARPLR